MNFAQPDLPMGCSLDQINGVKPVRDFRRGPLCLSARVVDDSDEEPEGSEADEPDRDSTERSHYP